MTLNGNPLQESTYNSETGVRSSTWLTGDVTKDTAYQCIASIGQDVKYTLDSYYDVFSELFKLGKRIVS